MEFFTYRDHELCAEQVSLQKIADCYGTPCYVYSRAALEKHWQAFNTPLMQSRHLICFAVKANSNLSLLKILANLGSGFDIVSGGELERVLLAGADPKKIIFSGVGKTVAEIHRALEVGIKTFNVESIDELKRINEIAAELNTIASIALRVNPDVDAKTHPYISTGLKENKFGIASEQVLPTYQVAASLAHINIIGIACHIGSQLLELNPFLLALEKLLQLIDQLQHHGIRLQQIDLGGGLGVHYQAENPPDIKTYVDALLTKLANKNLTLILEPGRAITANAGVLLTQVEYIKQHGEKKFAIVDAGMNDLLRPALYNAWHDILPLTNHSTAENAIYEVVGPVCETSDFLGKERTLAIEAQDRLAICGAGAYGFVMSSNYNTRPRAAEVLVDGQQFYLIRARETLADLFNNELEFLQESGEIKNKPIEFYKMHGLGNDFMVIDGINQTVNLSTEQIQLWSNRHTSVGFDQLLLLAAATDPEADFFYRIFNADGSEVAQCGNGARCITRFVELKKLRKKKTLTLQTQQSFLQTELIDNNQVKVNMGVAKLLANEIPLQNKYTQPNTLPATYTIHINETAYLFTVLSVGNPHAILFVEELATAPVNLVGAALQHHPAFPAQVNVSFAQIIDKNTLALRVFERGAGETQACGSGACAAVIAGQLRGLLSSSVQVKLTGGTLHIDCDGINQPIFLVGPAEFVYNGKIARSVCL